jgi:phosphate transport system substrate-binding protein
MRSSVLKINAILLLFVLSFTLGSCGKGDNKNSASDKELTGAGATFPFPLYSKMFDAYNKEKGVKVNYQSVGSGAGQQQLISKTVDFGASDAFMNDEQLSKVPAKIVQVPICLGAVVVNYNLEGVSSLKLTPEILSDIFMGKIKKWDDEKIKKVNPDAKLPGTDISVVHRSDGSGTSSIFTDYLSKVSEDWKKAVGSGTSVNWPAGLGAKGNEGVGGMVKQTPGSIGYVELIYALQNNMTMASLQNKKGNFIVPSLKSTNAAANVTIPEDTRVSLNNSDSDDGYPIVSFTWILLYQNQDYNSRSEGKAKEVVNLVWWMVHEGQQYNEPLMYATLPKDAVTKCEAILKSITFGDKKLLEK